MKKLPTLLRTIPATGICRGLTIHPKENRIWSTSSSAMCRRSCRRRLASCKAFSVALTLHIERRRSAG